METGYNKNNWNLIFERLNFQLHPMTYLVWGTEWKSWPLEIKPQVEVATSCPFPRTPIVHTNQIIDDCMVPVQDFILLLSMNGVFPFCFYLLTAENMSTVHSHNGWGGKLIPWGMRLFGLSWDILDIYSFFPFVLFQYTVKKLCHKSESMFCKVHICICYL